LPPKTLNRNQEGSKLHDDAAKKVTTHVIKAIGNNEEQKRYDSTETQDFNVENRLQQREVKTTGAS
jgi:hypothetical protein